MLSKPPTCEGCALAPLSTGFMRPQLSSNPYGVTLVGEALGEEEAEQGVPFVGKAGFRLTRLIEWAGLDRSRFDILNTVWCRPPSNRLEGEPYETPATNHCRERHWGSLLARSRVIVPLGNVAANVFLGHKGILTSRGYVYAGANGQYILPTVHPSFIARGNAKWSAAFILDLQKAVELAQRGFPQEFTEYTIDPSPLAAYEWAKGYQEALSADGRVRLAFDIETPGKPEEEDEADTGDDLPDATWNIFRIGFSYRPLHALSIPWEPPYYPTIRLLLGSTGDKIVWNAGFDVPRVRRAGFPASGTIHDGMVAWHILHSDLPKRLGFVATFTCPWQPAWKHLSGSRPGYYNACDADVELRSMQVIESELRRTGMWSVYQRDVLDLEPVLDHMRVRGMPVDLEVRADRARRLASRLQQVQSSLAGMVPVAARRIEIVYKKTPPDTTGLVPTRVEVPVTRCSVCGLENPTAPHFRTLKKPTEKRPQNPCAGGGKVTAVEAVDRFARLAEFKPSREQLIRYHQHLKRPLPMKWDKKAGRRKVSFGEAEIKKEMLKYPLDPLYAAVLEYRSIDKLAGTYVGRPNEVQTTPTIPGQAKAPVTV